MPTTLQEQAGVASDAAYWDVGRFRLWQSTVPEILLYGVRELGVAREAGGRYRASVTQVRRWKTGQYEVTGGSAVLGVFGAEDAREFEAEWIRAVLNVGYKESPHPRFLPLPMRDVRVTSMLNASGASQVEPAEGKDDSAPLVLKLTAGAAQDWARAILDKSTVAGRVRLSYSYPRMMPLAKATVTVPVPPARRPHPTSCHGARDVLGLGILPVDAGRVRSGQEHREVTWRYHTILPTSSSL